MPLPWQFETPITTQRLELRLMTLDDVDSIHAWMSDPDVVRYQLYEPRSRELVAEKVAEYSQAVRLENDDDYVQPVIVLDGVVIGAIYFKLTSVDDLTAEIGWVLRREFHGFGYAAEAAAAMLAVGFDELELHRVFAELDPRNASSIALCTRLGMREEAFFVEHLRFKGAWADTGIYAILEREWRSRNVSAVAVPAVAPVPDRQHEHRDAQPDRSAPGRGTTESEHREDRHRDRDAQHRLE